MKKLITICLAIAFMLVASPAQANFTVAGITFDDLAGVDTILSSSGSFTTSGGTLLSVLTDNLASTWAFSGDQGDYVQFGFTDNVLVNLAGNDLAVFEIGTPVDLVPLSLIVNGIQVTKTPVFTGYFTAGYNINVAYWDLSADFGLPLGTTLKSNVVIFQDVAGANPAQTIAFVGALNSAAPCNIPAPGAMILGSIGVSFVGWLRRRRSL